MNQTEHYGLNQWALTDRIEMKDFNADNAKLDAALAALSGLQGGEIARLDAAMAAETQRLNAELAKKALASDLATAKTDLETALKPKLEQVTLLSSKSYTLSGTSTSITIPGSEIAKCSLAAVIATPSNTSQSLFYAGSGTDSTHHSIGSYDSSAGLFKLYSSRIHVFVFFPMKGACPYVCGIGFAQGSFSSFYSPLSYSAFTSLVLRPVSSDGTLTGKVTLKIYGLQ